MGFDEMIIFIIEIFGTIAFAASGAMVGINKKMDVFGVCVLGITTACGGGMIRDISLSMIPSSLLKPVYIELSIVTSLVVFVIYYFRKVVFNMRNKALYDNIMMAVDSLGLGIFTAVGVDKGIDNAHVESLLLYVYLGTVTGVGGGLLRDIMAGVKPYIFTKHVYACASIAGAFVYVWVYDAFGEISAIVSCTVVVVIIRYLARHYKWNLPRIDLDS